MTSQGLLFFVNINMFFTGLLGVVLIFPEERRLFEREFASGYYGARWPIPDNILFVFVRRVNPSPTSLLMPYSIQYW